MWDLLEMIYRKEYENTIQITKALLVEQETGKLSFRKILKESKVPNYVKSKLKGGRAAR